MDLTNFAAAVAQNTDLYRLIRSRQDIIVGQSPTRNDQQCRKGGRENVSG